jgi:hypothetical protein
MEITLISTQIVLIADLLVGVGLARPTVIG